MAVAHAHQVETQHCRRIFVVNDAHAFASLRVFPIDGDMIFRRLGLDIAIHLIFNVEEFGGVEPDAGIIRLTGDSLPRDIGG